MRRESDGSRFLAKLETAGIDVCRERMLKGRRDGGAERDSAVKEEARAADPRGFGSLGNGLVD